MPQEHSGCLQSLFFGNVYRWCHNVWFMHQIISQEISIFFCKTEKKNFNLFIPLCMITPALKFNRKMHNSYFLKTVLFDIELSLFVYTCMPVLTIWARKHDVYLYLVGFCSKKIHNYMNRCTGTHDIYQWGTSLSLVIESQFSTDCDIVRVCFMHVNTNF